jgi:hypothetical protein
MPRRHAGWEHHVAIWKFDDDQPAAVIEGLPKGVYTLDFSAMANCSASGAPTAGSRVWALKRR